MNQYDQIREADNDDIQAVNEDWFKEILIVFAGLSSLFGFWIFYSLYQYQGDKFQQCYHFDQLVYYYYHYLFMSSVGQLICFLFLVIQRICISPAKYRQNLKRQLTFQEWDTGIMLTLLTILYCFVYTMRRRCNLQSTTIILLAYTFWEIVLFSLISST